eukprot:84417_1
MDTQELNCSTSSIITTQITIAYGIIYALTLIVVSIYSFRFLNEYNQKFNNSSFVKKLWKWFKDLWRRRRCYIPIITHLFDQITDVSVAMQFYELSITKSSNNYEQCGGLNMWYLFILTILSMIIYRLMSSYLIYKFTNKSLQHFIFQLFDIELFRALYINYLCNKLEPCDPQRWITAMEASLESTPQSVIQMIYLVKTNTFNSSYLVLISLLSSLWSIISKLVSDDKIIVIQTAKKANFKCSHFIIFDILFLIVGIIIVVISIIISPCLCCYMLFVYINDKYPNYRCCCNKTAKNVKYHTYEEYEATKQINTHMKRVQGEILRKDYELEVPDLKQPTQLFDNKTGDTNKENKSFFNIKNHLNLKWISWWYILRLIWRILDVSSRIFICTLCWIIIGGTWLTIIISFEFITILIISYNTKQWELIFSIVALVVSYSNGLASQISLIIFIYRTITNYILMILITIWLTVQFECWRCTDYFLRNEYLFNNTIFILFIYCWISIFILPYIMVLLEYNNIFQPQASTSRD